MRRVVILAVLFSSVQLVLLLGQRGHGAQTLLAFGFLIVAAYTIGELASAARLPRIVGYMGAGMLFGPSVLGTVPADAVKALMPVSSLAIALIAFLAGAELRMSEVRERGIAILKIMSTEMTLTFLSLVALLVGLRVFVPFLDGLGWPETIALSALFASMAVVHSPAVTMALLTETGAHGPVARTTLGVVLISDVAVIVLFSTFLTIARTVVPAGSDAATVTLLGVVWEIVGSILVGAALGGAVALYLRLAKHELFLFAILVTVFGADLARLLHVETLLTLLVAGFVTENASRPSDGTALRQAMERSAAPVFVVFFALAGAEIALGTLTTVWVLVIPVVLVRALAIYGGTSVGARWARVTPVEMQYTWMGLISQAGVAVGLATILASVYPERGESIRTLFLATLAVNQIAGPILFRRALARSNELDGTAPVVPGGTEEGASA
jgi:Kef-type K+ transport system membrane component KefB